MLGRALSDPGAETESPTTALPRSATTGVALLALAVFALEWGTSWLGTGGFFIDELYYLACAERPGLGYVDHPPLAPFVLALSRPLLGDSLPALRFLPALCGAGTVFVAVRLAGRLGGGAFARVLTAVCMRSVMPAATQGATSTRLVSSSCS